MNDEEKLVEEIANAIKSIGCGIENLWIDAIDFTAGEKMYSLNIEERK